MIAGIEAMLCKGLGVTNDWTVKDQNDLPARLFGIRKVKKAGSAFPLAGNFQPNLISRACPEREIDRLRTGSWIRYFKLFEGGLVDGTQALVLAEALRQ